MIDLKDLIPNPEEFSFIKASTFIPQCTVAIHEIKDHDSFKRQNVDFTFTIKQVRKETEALTGAFELRFIDDTSLIGGRAERIIVFISVDETVIDLAGGHKMFSDVMLKSRIIYELDRLFGGTAREDIIPIPSDN